LSCSRIVVVPRVFGSSGSTSGGEDGRGVLRMFSSAQMPRTLFSRPEYAKIVAGLKQKLKLIEVGKNDLRKSSHDHN
jgi:hypothetical protein